MIRVCIQCKHIFGCQGFDSKKWKCNACPYYSSCTTRIMLDPPTEEITGGVCDWCFENLVIQRRKRFLPNGTKYA